MPPRSRRFSARRTGVLEHAPVQNFCLDKPVQSDIGAAVQDKGLFRDIPDIPDALLCMRTCCFPLLRSMKKRGLHIKAICQVPFLIFPLRGDKTCVQSVPENARRKRKNRPVPLYLCRSRGGNLARFFLRTSFSSNSRDISPGEAGPQFGTMAPWVRSSWRISASGRSFIS